MHPNWKGSKIIFADDLILKKNPKDPTKNILELLSQ